MWATKDDRSHFYHQSTGFGLLSERMEKAPSVFFFGDGDYARLEETGRWAVHVLTAKRRDGQTHERLDGLQEERFVEYTGQYQFAARQGRVEFEKLYKGNERDYALVGILNIGADHTTPGMTAGLTLEACEIELGRHQILLFPIPSTSEINAPVGIADLTSRQPWEYGILSHDDGKFKNSAYPMSMSFRPMSTLHLANKFLSARSRQNSVVTEVREQYTVCIVSASKQRIIENEEVGRNFEELRKDLGLLDGQDGLREVRVLRGIALNTDSYSVRFVCSK